MVPLEDRNGDADHDSGDYRDNDDCFQHGLLTSLLYQTTI